MGVMRSLTQVSLLFQFQLVVRPCCFGPEVVRYLMVGARGGETVDLRVSIYILYTK